MKKKADLKTYLVKFYYMDYDFDKYEYCCQEMLLSANDKTIKDVVNDYIKDMNKKYGYKIEQVNVYKPLYGYSLKNNKNI